MKNNPLNLQPKKKRKKSKDPSWSKRDGKRKKSGTTEGAKTFGSIAQLNKILVSPAKQVKIVTEKGINIAGSLCLDELNQEDLTLSTPHKGACANALLGKNEKLLRARTIETHQGKVSIFLSENKVDKEAYVKLPSPPQDLVNLLKAKNFPQHTNSQGFFDVEITLESLKAIRAQKRKHQIVGSSERQPTNAQVVHYNRANAIAKILGLEGNDWQWWHLVGHALLGDRAQHIENFVLGKLHDNSKMNDLAEDLVEKILLKLKKLGQSPKLYLSVTPEWVPGFEMARLAKKVTWTLKDTPTQNPKHCAIFEFDPLSTDVLSKSEKESVEQVLMHIFLADAPIEVVSPGKNPKATLLLSPAKKPQNFDMQPTNDFAKKNLLSLFEKEQVNLDASSRSIESNRKKKNKLG